MRLHRAIVVIVAGLLVAACAADALPGTEGSLRLGSPAASATPALPGTLATPAAPGKVATPAAPGASSPDATGSTPPWDPSPIDSSALLGSAEPLAVPGEPLAAAAYLASQVRSPTSARAAVREILLRSGIGIFRTDTGALAAVPADPSLVNAYLYEFEVPALADAVARGGSTSVAPILGLLVALEWVPADTTVQQVEDLLSAWLDATAANPAGAASFAGLAVRELMKADAAAKAGPDGPAEPGAARLDPLAFQLFLASLVSDPGHFSGQAWARPSVVLASVRNAPPAVEPVQTDDYVCDEPAKEYDSGLMDKAMKELAKVLGKETFGSSWTKAASTALDYGKILSTVQARAALLSGLSINVASDAKGTPHYRHSTGDTAGASVWRFTATAGFQSALGGRIINCGALAGLRIPDNRGIEGLRLQWAISDNVECTELSQNCDSLGRIRSGGGGDSTNADGQSKLQVETIIEDGCPSPTNPRTDTSRCNKGPVVKGTAWATVTPDLTTTPPLKLADLLFKPSGLVGDTAKALVKVLVDVATEMATALKTTKGTQAVAYHKVTDYRVDFTNGLTISGSKCKGYTGPWALRVSGHPDPSTTASGAIDFTLDEDARGKGTISFDIVTKVKAGGRTIIASVTVDGTVDVELLNPGDSSSLLFTNFKGGGKGVGTDGNLMLKKAFSAKGGTSGMPVQQGTFCTS